MPSTHSRRRFVSVAALAGVTVLAGCGDGDDGTGDGQDDQEDGGDGGDDAGAIEESPAETTETAEDEMATETAEDGMETETTEEGMETTAADG